MAVFAHNEERDIVACLTSLISGHDGAPPPIHVLVNGCTDSTTEVVRSFAHAHPTLEIHEIELGDKANAWNVYIHTIADAALDHVFIDGDVRAGAQALPALKRALEANPRCHAVTGVPGSGRSAARWIEEMRTDGGLAGNLYALRSTFVCELRARAVRIPIGLIGEDALVGAMAAFSLDPPSGWNRERIAVAEDARFEFTPLRIYAPSDIRLYMRRRVRYALRTIQNRMTRIHVRRHGFAALPERVSDLYRGYPSELHSSGSLTDRIFGRLALRKIRNDRT